MLASHHTAWLHFDHINHPHAQPSQFHDHQAAHHQPQPHQATNNVFDQSDISLLHPPQAERLEPPAHTE